MQLFADDQGNAGWITAAGIALLAILREVGSQMGVFATRKQAAVNEVVKGQGDLITILQTDVKEMKAENKECNRRTARLEREVIRLGGNPDVFQAGSAEHESLKPGMEENDL